MRDKLIFIIILGMVVETYAVLRVHQEYMRRQFLRGQSKSIEIHTELPSGVHAAYIQYRLRHNVLFTPSKKKNETK